MPLIFLATAAPGSSPKEYHVPMTLLVAAKSDSEIWMVADTAIIGGTLSARDHENEIKIVPSVDKRGLIGFAGDYHDGVKAIHQAANLATGKDAINVLQKASAANKSLDFAYGYFDGKRMRLLRVSKGQSEQLPTFHLGSQDAFRHLQKIRHRKELNYAPRSLYFDEHEGGSLDL